MSRAEANPAHLRQFARELRSTREEIRQLVKSLERRLTSLDWDDDVKRRIDADVRTTAKGLVSFTDRLDQQAREVERKAAVLEQYTR
jgi:ABC-type transporter Mla subunit MlaD